MHYAMVDFADGRFFVRFMLVRNVPTILMIWPQDTAARLIREATDFQILDMKLQRELQLQLETSKLMKKAKV